MNFNLSDIKFPNYVTGLADVYNEWMAGGYNYQTQAPGWTIYFVNQEVRQINLSELSWSRPSEHVLESDWYTFFTFPNGYEAKMKFSRTWGDPTISFNVTANWFDKDGNALGNIPSEAGYNGYTNNNTGYPTSWGNLDDGNFVAYLFLNTIYYPTANPPQDTPNNGLAFYILVGNTAYGFEFGNGAKALPTSGRIGNWFTIGTWTDLELFDTYLHSHGDPFDGFTFSKDPLPGEPAGGGDNSGTGGGGGNYDPTSDPIDFPSLPVGGPLTSGMIKGFVMNSGNLIGLQSKLWDMSIFDIATQFQKLVNQPLDCLISLHCLPFIPTEGATPEEIKLGSFATGISANRVTAQYMEIDAGSIAVSEYWGSALDYAPFTQVEIYVPFVGIRNLKIEDIEGLTLALKYHVDVLTGDCVAYLKCGQSVLYSWTGNCLTHVPCTANSSDLLAKNIAAVGAVGVGIATGNPAAAAAGSIAGAVNTATAKNHVQRSGEVAGSPGLMSEFNAYLIFHRPKQSLAKDYNKFKGYTCNITYKLSSLKGYTEVEHIHLTGISGATDAELAEIKSLLTEGVII